MNFGELKVDVWPPYVGMSTGENPHAGEPFHDLDYKRGMITWRTDPHGLIWGSARVYLPKGIYTHVVFFWGPDPIHGIARANQLEQPHVADRSGFVDLDPIVNKDYLPRM